MKVATFLITVVLLSIMIFGWNIYPQDTADIKNSTHQNSGKMIVKIKGFSSDNGTVKIALNNSKQNYKEGQPFRAVEARIINDSSEYVFNDIPFGEYAIKCYHDENGNGEMDKNFLGIPSEDYGFSNNARGSFGPPDYEDAKFLFSANNQVIELTIE